MNMDRFQQPGMRDDLAQCAKCGETFHYTALDSDGHCEICHEMPKQPSRKDYLGDSVYVDINDGMLVLTTDNGMGASNTIFLEPAVIKSLLNYIERQQLKPK